jgi:hypothetical protein
MKTYTSKIAASIILGGLLASTAAQATLFDRGGGLLYDDVLNVTWLQDSNYARSSGYATASNGMMNWYDASQWAANLNYFDNVRGVTYSDWRLPTATPVNPDAPPGSGIANGWNINYKVDGSSDVGRNIAGANSELGYMYYANLGLKSDYGVDGTYQPNFGLLGNGNYAVNASVGLVRNLTSSNYWSATSLFGVPTDDMAMQFSQTEGFQSFAWKQWDPGYAWAVRDGDVASMAAPIPEPETYALMLAGLGLLGIARRRRSARLPAGVR